MASRDALCELGGQRVSVADGSGVGEGGAGRVERATVSVGQHDHRKARPTTTETPASYTYDLGPNGYNPTWRHRGTSLHESGGIICAERVWAYTTWLGMCGSGVGIGMGRRMLEAAIHAAPRQAPPVCYGAATGSPAPTGAGRRTVTTRLPVGHGLPTSGSGLCCPQASELKRAA